MPLPNRLKPYMFEQDLLPRPERTIPRNSWVGGVFLIPPLADVAGHDLSRLHWAARAASQEWTSLVGEGAHIDHECFCLTVVDKVIEDVNYTRQRRNLGFEPIFPTFAEWKKHTNESIQLWYSVAVRHLPPTNPVPPFQETYRLVRPAITWMYRRGADAQASPAGLPPRYDRGLLGRFDPNARELPPVVRLVQPLQLRDGEPPSSEPNPVLDAQSEDRRRQGRNFRVEQTIVLPPVCVNHAANKNTIARLLATPATLSGAAPTPDSPDFPDVPNSPDSPDSTTTRVTVTDVSPDDEESVATPSDPCSLSPQRLPQPAQGSKDQDATS